MYSDWETVHCTVEDGVATIALSRPDVGNAMDATMCLELVEALDAADADDAVRVVVLAAAGRHFCVGADLSEGFIGRGATLKPAQQRFVDLVGEIDGVPRDAGGYIALRIAAMLTPVVAAVHGAAVGVGATLTLPADIRVVGREARIGFVFGRRGLNAEAASSWFLPRIVGITRAQEWVLTGRLIAADEVLAAGYATRVVDTPDVLATAHSIAREIAEHTSAVASSVNRQLLWSMLSAPDPWHAHAAESLAVHELGGGADVAEGVASFLEKRPPRFAGSVPADYPTRAPRWPARPRDL